MQKIGNFVIKNIPGSVTLAGRATALVNSNNSMGVSDVTPLSEHMDSTGVTRTLTRDQVVYQMDLELTPGIGQAFGTFALLQAAAVMVKKGDSIVTSGFDVSTLNWASGDYGIVWETSISPSNGGLFTMRVTARRWCTVSGSTETAVNFASGWVNLA
jgi:hypothetical protein